MTKNLFAIEIINMLVDKDRPRPVGRKTSEVGVKNRFCLSDGGADLDGFSQNKDNFKLLSTSAPIFAYLILVAAKKNKHVPLEDNKNFAGQQWLNIKNK